MTETRKLAAILAADVADFSRLTAAEEERTLARMRALRSDLIDPTIAVHNGRVVKRTGDGYLVDFRSVVDAARCAIEIQNSMIERNAGLPPERRIELRIGIHLGDVVEESDGDLMGDGVNIAARLQSVAKPGTICLSDDAYRQVRARLDVVINDLGATQLKNIAEPMRVYSLQVGIAAQAKPAASSAAPDRNARTPAGIEDSVWARRVKQAPLAVGAALAVVAAAAAGWIALGGRSPWPSSRDRPPVSAAGPAATAEQRREIAFKRMLAVMRDNRFSWRTVERLAIDAGVTENEAHEILAAHPDEIVLGKSRDGKLIARLAER